MFFITFVFVMRKVAVFGLLTRRGYGRNIVALPSSLEFFDSAMWRVATTNWNYVFVYIFVYCGN